jgi:hypothetical protein
MSNNADDMPGHVAKLMRLVGTLVYTIFKVGAWIVGLAALGSAILSYMIGAMEPIPGAVGVAVGTAIVYLIVTKVVRSICLAAPAGLVDELRHPGI